MTVALREEVYEVLCERTMEELKKKPPSTCMQLEATIGLVTSVGRHRCKCDSATVQVFNILF